MIDEKTQEQIHEIIETRFHHLELDIMALRKEMRKVTNTLYGVTVKVRNGATVDRLIDQVLDQAKDLARARLDQPGWSAIQEIQDDK